MDINGTRFRVSPKHADVINGAKYGVTNGLGARDYDKWRMSWNGNVGIAPPDPGSVLYLPGYPGFGTTIFDYSYNFNDSGIDTNEVLDATETGIDCDADATTAIPVGSIIIIEEEWCKVTATGVSLTVIRGYHGTTAATHTTNQDIRTWLPNHGTITGATWVRLPTGMDGVLRLNGSSDRVNCGTGASLNITGVMTGLIWFQLNAIGAMQGLIHKGHTATIGYRTYQLRIKDTNVLNFAAGDGTNQVDGSTALVTGVWYLGGFVRTDATHVTLYLNGVADSVSTVVDAGVDKATDILNIGAISSNATTWGSFLNGSGILCRISNLDLTTQMSQIYKDERHLFP